MRVERWLLGATCVLCSATVWAAGPERELSKVRWAEVDLGAELPRDLLEPEGRTSWDLRQLVLGERWTVTVSEVRDPEAGPGLRSITERPRGRTVASYESEQAQRWLLPHRTGDLGRGRVLDPIRFAERVGESTLEVELLARRVGAGRVYLPDGSREVVLQRVLERVTPAGGGAPVENLVHRWVDPRAGVVAEVRGPAMTGQAARLSVDSARLAEAVLLGGTPMRIYSDEINPVPFGRLNYGFDRDAVCRDGVTACSDDSGCDPPDDSCGVTVASLTPDNATTIWDLACDPDPGTQECRADFWDFSGNNLTNFPGMREIGSTFANVDSSQTCEWNSCGFTGAGYTISREDLNFSDPPNAIKTITSQEYETRPGDVTIWLRGGVRNEGATGGLGTGETAQCWVGDGRTEVPLYRFSNQDAGGFYMELGDAWTSDPIDCEISIFNQGFSPCPGNCGTLTCQQYVSSCTANCGVGADQAFSGTLGSEVVNEGVVRLPSGHELDVQVIRNVTEFCASPVLFGCNGIPVPVRTVLYLWQAPHLGTVVRLMGNVLECDATSFEQVAEMDVKFALFPPLSIQVDQTGETTVDISWDPGLETHRIDGYRVYWDTQSGGSCSTGGEDCTADHPGADPCPANETCCATPGDVCASYAFNSFDNPGQVAFNGTSATISGLTTDTDYFITVTSVSDYTNPASLVTTTYESLLYPTQVDGGVAAVPAEVLATTGGACAPTEEVQNFLGSRVPGGVEFCWDLVTDVCASGYSILGAASPEAEGNFSEVATSVGPCAQFDPTESYFLVRSSGPGGGGPLGHFDP